MSNLSPNNYQDPKGYYPECFWCGSFGHDTADCPELKELEEQSEETE